MAKYSGKLQVSLISLLFYFTQTLLRQAESFYSELNELIAKTKGEISLIVEANSRRQDSEQARKSSNPISPNGPGAPCYLPSQDQFVRGNAPPPVYPATHSSQPHSDNHMSMRPYDQSRATQPGPSLPPTSSAFGSANMNQPSRYYDTSRPPPILQNRQFDNYGPSSGPSTVSGAPPYNAYQPQNAHSGYHNSTGYQSNTPSHASYHQPPYGAQPPYSSPPPRSHWTPPVVNYQAPVQNNSQPDMYRPSGFPYSQGGPNEPSMQYPVYGGAPPSNTLPDPRLPVGSQNNWPTNKSGPPPHQEFQVPMRPNRGSLMD
jgi:hypothetical protein